MRLRRAVCRYCLHDVQSDLELIVCSDSSYFACSDLVWCDFRACERGLHLGHHIEGA